MIKTLFAKLTLVLMLFFLLLSIFTLSITFFVSDLYQQEVLQKLNNDVAKHIVDDTQLFDGEEINYSELKKLFHSIMVLNPSLEIYLLDNEGGILAFSAPPWKVVRLSVDLEPVQRALAGQSLLPVRGDDPRNHKRSKVFSVATIPFNAGENHYLYIILGGEEYDSIVERIKGSYILSNSLIVIIIGLLFVFVMGLIMFAGLTGRLRRLAKAVLEFENKPHQLPAFPPVQKSADEIDQLNGAFRSMALKIYHQINELHATDHLRRELVANVSHDLRTPLATLQGYIETMLIKEEDISYEQRKEYLRTAIKHCTSLNRLVSELFELARLDASETKPSFETFNLAELIEDIIQQFALKTRASHITLKTDYDSNHLFVYADIGLIERVLENLLENAIRFVKADGLIVIALEEQGDFIRVKVSDNGVGIPEKELPYIFDRFYQLDKNRPGDSENSGLGLAIVKRIMELHDSMINVSSIPGHETMFSFRLPTHI